MVLLPKVKLKTLPTFPANIIGGVGLAATKSNGSLTLDFAWQEFGAISAIPTSPTSYMLTYDTATGAYVMVPSHLLGGAVSGIADAPNDGIQYGRQSTAWTPITGNFIQAGSGAVSRTMQDKARERVSVMDFGAVGNGSADDTSHIQDAIYYVTSIGGGTVYFPPGAYLISATLVVGHSDVKLVGAGMGDFHYSPTGIFAATRLVWNGASTGYMVLFSPADTHWIAGCAFEGIYLDHGSGVDRGIVVYSSQQGRFIINGDRFNVSLAAFGCSSSLTETADCLGNYIEIKGTTSPNGALAQFLGTATANFCFNRVSIEGQYFAGACVQLYNCDNNIFEHIRLYRNPTDTGPGIALVGGDVGQEARSNVFIDCSPGAGGVAALGTETGAASPSKNNYIQFYDVPNFAPPPTYGTGATLWYGRNDSIFPCVAVETNGGTFGAGIGDVNWSNKIFDLTNSFGSTTFTAPKPGKYRVSWRLSHTSGVTVGDKWLIHVTTSTEDIVDICMIGAAQDNTISGGCMVNLLMGQTVKMSIERAAGSGVFQIVTDFRFNRLDINYVSMSF